MPIRGANLYVPGHGDGLPGHITLPGDPAIIPAGLEAVLEYNGLLLNIQKNIDRYRITQMDFFDADVRDTRDQNTGDDGETPYDSFYGGRTITISGTIDTYSIGKVRSMQYALKRAFVDIRNEYPLIFRTGDFRNDHMIYCKKIGPISGIEQQAGMRATRDFQISLRASNPRFLSFYERFVQIFPPNPTVNLTQIATISNVGEYKSQAVFRIWGPSTGVTFLNDATNQKFTINKRIPSRDYLEFYMGSPPTLKNSSGANRWNMLQDDSKRIDIIPGDNPIFYTGDSNRVQISWRDSWI